MSRWRGVIEEYADFLPSVRGHNHIPAVTLFEGGTPLITAAALSERVGARVMLKFEGLNPTGSFKDRGMTVAVTAALAQGAKSIVCASTGNTSAAAAAYAVRAGMQCVVLIPDGHIAIGKLAQALMYGADVLQIRGSFDDALDIVRKLGVDGSIAVVNSINPERIEGQKTAAFEVIDSLGEAPDFQFMPVGNAGNITAYWRGYKEYKQAGRSKRLPRMMGFQAAGAAPLVSGQPVNNPETIATAIRIGRPASWKNAVEAVTESNGAFAAVTDEEIIDAYKFVAANEGVFCEPASAASIAGLFKTPVPEGSTVVCVLTGNGLKDSDLAIASSPTPVKLDATEDAIRRHLKM